MPENWIDAAAIEITKHSQFYCLGDIEKIAQIIREEYEKHQIEELKNEQLHLQRAFGMNEPLPGRGFGDGQ